MTLKELILSNPELPVIITVTKYEEDSSFILGEGISESVYENPEAYIGEFFDHDDFRNSQGHPYMARDEVKEAIYDNAPRELSDNELEAEMAKYEQYWEKCIIVEL